MINEFNDQGFIKVKEYKAALIDYLKNINTATSNEREALPVAKRFNNVIPDKNRPTYLGRIHHG